MTTAVSSGEKCSLERRNENSQVEAETGPSPDRTVTLGVVILEAGLLKQVETLISTDVRLVEETKAIDCIERDHTSVDPVSDGSGYLVVDGHSPVQVLSVAQQIGGVHPVSLASSAAVIVTILRAGTSVQVYHGLQAQLPHPGEGSPQVEQGAALTLLLQVGGGQ